MVTFRGADGKEQFRIEEHLEDAVRLVEQIRNGGDVADLHLWQVSEIPLEFRAYYRVELSQDPAVETHSMFDATDMQTTILPPEPMQEVAAEAMAASEPVVVSAEGRTDAPSFGIFSR